MADSKNQDFKEAKKAQKRAKREQRKNTRKQIWQAFQMQRKQDKALVPIMLAAFLGMGLLFFLLGSWWGGQWIMLIVGLSFGAALAMWLFSRRLQNSVYDRADGQTGAAGWALENLRSGMGIAWRTKTAVAMTRQMDVLHRVVGVSGVVLVGEGNPNHLKNLVNQQKRRIEKLVPGVPVEVVTVGSEKDQVPLKNLQRHLMKMPKRYKKDEVYQIAGRLEAMDAVNSGQPLPKGPLPGGGKMSGMNRAARRAAERNKKG
ncbi:DUF4191 domain-containing protein [Corynebacterium gerontici]|uniref:DUF4191 domain-containing protein n=1 Tax=Corynebacterium gerontici TaxID=2079234 RepID=A0A3G6J717_9CORY|nr:DUF4191 domain-containing protein [Corynebacterium gerontici]AZA11814.1 hypothetical protein CGERO_07570 [Corynebacterium gerontici]